MEVFTYKNNKSKSNNNNNISIFTPILKNRFRITKREYFFYRIFNTPFLELEIISTLIVLFIFMFNALFSYELPFFDPIKNVKTIYIYSQIFFLVLTFGLSIFIYFFSKKDIKIILKSFKILSLFSLFIILIFVGIKLYIDAEYNTESNFTSFYIKYYEPQIKSDTESNLVFNLNLSDMKLETTKESYISNSFYYYSIFTIKVNIYLILQILISILIIFVTFKLFSKNKEKQHLEELDSILFDTEENIKF